ncbi:MAG: FUSC family protein [Saprospiraceae bacterium]|nr:FUSC family protein [Saprospiraceae bacterium]
MTENELAELTDEALLAQAKEMKSSSITTAFFIGFLVGIILYSVFNNSWGLVTLIPLFLIYKLVNNPKKNDALKAELIRRGLD